MWKDHAHFNAELLEVRDTNTLLNYGPHTHSLGSWRNQTSSCFIYSIILAFLITLVIYKERELKLALRKNCIPVCISRHFFTKIYTAQQGFMRYLPVKKAQKYSYGNIVYLQLLILLSLLYKLLV